MVVPAVRVVVGDDHGGVLPGLGLLDLFDGAGDEFPLVDGVGVGGVAILGRARLEEGHGRHLAISRRTLRVRVANCGVA
jgi:hypothetical protein